MLYKESLLAQYRSFINYYKIYICLYIHQINERFIFFRLNYFYLNNVMYMSIEEYYHKIIYFPLNHIINFSKNYILKIFLFH